MTPQLPVTVLLGLVTVARASYDDAYALERFLFTNYSTRIIPVQNHSQPIEVSCSFLMASLVGVDELHSELSLLAQMTISWVDEKLQWSPSEHGNITSLHPYPKDVWRPRFQLMNSLNAVDPFEDNYDLLVLYHTGQVTWRPNGFFSSFCNLDLKKFPFDEHSCHLVFKPIFTIDYNIKITVTKKDAIIVENYAESGEWTLKHTAVSSILGGGGAFSWILLVTLDIQRRPEFFIMNFLIPVMLLSVLNLLSFTMVVGDGSVNIGHSMTVLLAYTIYMSILIDHLPSVSLDMPYLTFYLFILFVISLLTTIDIVFIVWLHNKEEEEEKKQKRESKLKTTMNKVVSLKWFGSKQISAFGNNRDRIPPQTQNNSAKDSCLENTRDSAYPDDPLSYGETLHFNFGQETTKEGASSNSVPYDVTAGRHRVNRYKNLSEKVRIYSLYVFIVINLTATTLTCVTLAH